MGRRKNAVKFLVLLAFIAAAVYLFRYSPIADQLTPSMIQEWVEGMGIWGAFTFIAIYAIGAALAVPGTVLTFVGAVLFGTILGTIVNVVGATLGASLSFILAQHLGRDFVQSLMKGKFKEFQDKVEKEGFNCILLLRLVPLFPFNGINYCSGVCKIRFRDYCLGTLLGIIPGTFAYTYLFATVGEKALQEGFTLSALLSPDLIAPIVLFVLLIAGSVWYKRRADKKNKLPDVEDE